MLEVTVPQSDFTNSVFSNRPQSGVSPERNLSADFVREDFISMITHDLRAPLANLSMFLQMTRAGLYKQSEPVFEDRVQQLIPELARINRLVDELLQLNKNEAEKQEFNLQIVSSRRLVEAAVNAVRHSAQAKSISIIKECTAVAIACDADRVTRVIVNLLQNAIKFSPDSGTILIRADVVGVDLYISVIDEGPGIDAQDCTRIFQRYEQGKTQSNDGVGLGLAVAKAFIAEHRGMIGVKPRQGAKGSQFWFSLPLGAASTSDFSPVIVSS